MAVSECGCVKWHAPKPSRYFQTKDGDKVCIVSGQAALDLMDRFRQKGRVTKVAQVGFTGFQKDLALKLFKGEDTLELLDAVEAPEEPEGEAEGSSGDGNEGAEAPVAAEA